MLTLISPIPQQRAWHPDDKPEWQKGLEDNDFWHIYITGYTVADHFTSVGQVIGTYEEKATSYRESVNNIRHFLENVSYMTEFHVVRTGHCREN